MLARLSAWSGGDPVRRRELAWLVGAIALGLAVRVAYVLITKDGGLGVDEADYDRSARFAADGHWMWFTPPYGVPHPGLWKAPGYPLWVGLIYSVLGPGPNKVMLIQTLLGPAVILMTWVLARRLFGSRAAIAAAVIAALYPHLWQWEASLHPEALALPLALGFYLVVLGREPTPRRAAAAGLLLGASLLVRPTSLALLALPAAAWWVARGTRGLGMAAVTAAVAVAVVAPWTVRNAVKYEALVPISVQDAAIAGTFNDDAARDPVQPWAWRVYVRRDRDVVRRPRSDAEFRSVLQKRARAYIREHPSSLPKAFFWNGLVRTWEIQRPSRILDQVRFDGRSRGVEKVALAAYWILLALAIAGLWRHRRRRDLVAGVLALALASSLLFTIAAATRYRVPFEPLIVILACSLLAPRAQITGRPARTLP